MVATRRLTGLTDRLQSLLDLRPGKPVVALSGGADSAALAYLLSRGVPEVRAVHINHSLPHSARLEAAAREVASTLDLALEVATVKVPDGASPEGRARTVRYAALVEASRPGDVILTAHTLDDQAETVLLNVLRGTGSRGLTGIPIWRPPNINRPFLRVTRSETRELALLAGLPFFDDPMNQEMGLARNVIRLGVLPELLRFNPQLIASLARMADAVRLDSETLDREAETVPIVFDEHRAQVACGALTTVPPAVANRVLARMVGRFREHASLGAEEMERVWRVVRGQATTEELIGGLIVRRSGPMLRFEHLAGPPPSDVKAALGPGRHRLGDTVFDVELVDEVCRVAPLGTWDAIFAPDANLVARMADGNGLVVEADGEPAWLPGVRRAPVAWYEPATRGYLSVSAREESEWTSSP
ncbi:MAG TPA: tRNA lysidine(34) synthetase TilS [Acidimicrobiia bacterium]|nr:tRNA lysidine(34) synthetase TilS [Acidimicrobiia bacterium]